MLESSKHTRSNSNVSGIKSQQLGQLLRQDPALPSEPSTTPVCKEPEAQLPIGVPTQFEKSSVTVAFKKVWKSKEMSGQI